MPERTVNRPEARAIGNPPFLEIRLPNREPYHILDADQASRFAAEVARCRRAAAVSGLVHQTTRMRNIS